MQTHMNTDEIERELRATISARREVGSAYEDHLIDAFMQRLNQRALIPQPLQPQATHSPSGGQRLALAIVSLALLLPLILLGFVIYLSVHGGSGVFFTFLAMICLTMLGVNYLFNKHR